MMHDTSSGHGAGELKHPSTTVAGVTTALDEIVEYCSETHSMLG